MEADLDDNNRVKRDEPRLLTLPFELRQRILTYVLGNLTLHFDACSNLPSHHRSHVSHASDFAYAYTFWQWPHAHCSVLPALAPRYLDTIHIHNQTNPADIWLQDPTPIVYLHSAGSGYDWASVQFEHGLRPNIAYHSDLTPLQPLNKRANQPELVFAENVTAGGWPADQPRPQYTGYDSEPTAGTDPQSKPPECKGPTSPTAARNLLAIAATCQILHEESLALFYKTVTLHFLNFETIPAVIARVPAQHRNAIHSIAITAVHYPRRFMSLRMRELVRSLKGLRRVQMALVASGHKTSFDELGRYPPCTPTDSNSDLFSIWMSLQWITALRALPRHCTFALVLYGRIDTSTSHPFNTPITLDNLEGWRQRAAALANPISATTGA